MNEHIKVIKLAIDYIEERIEEKLKVESVAKVAHYSPYYFYRMFKGITGYSVKDYIRRRRLTRAAYDIATSSDSLLDIAIKFGFESQASFTRSFKEIFGMAPGHFRRRPIGSNFLVKHDLEKWETNLKKLGGFKMKPKLMNFPDMTVIGMSVDGLKSIGAPKRVENQNVIPALWDAFNEKFDLISNKISPERTYGICLPDETGLHFNYVCAVEVAKNATPPEQMIKLSLDGGRYALFTHEGPVETIAPFTETIYESYLPQSDLKFRHAAEIELYDKRFKHPADPSSQMDICIPVQE